MIHSFVFSPSGTTAKIADAITRCLGMETTSHNLTVKASGNIDISSDADIAVFAMPVYAGRIPALAADRLQAVSGKGQNAVVTVVYGNRDYDDALIELADIATARGFNVVAAGAFIAQHCIFPKVATGRPDSGDAQKLAEFARIAAQAAADGHRLDLDKIKGKRPYKKAAG
ncbi:MAG: 4Fe-4S ferredoxin, partial [Muribaculaceae bacterium]|nr:4Fe-4S ferredoxin [Muribaculaceae bacterium]